MSKRIKLATLTPDDRNHNLHTATGMAQLEKSIQQVGVIESITVSNDGKIISGNARHEVMGQQLTADAIVVETDGTHPIILKRTDIESNTPQFYKAAIFANTTAKQNINIDKEVVAGIAADYDLDVQDLGVTIVDATVEEGGDPPPPQDDPREPLTLLWPLGVHDEVIERINTVGYALDLPQDYPAIVLYLLDDYEQRKAARTK